MAIDWSVGYESTWRLFNVNEGTWADSGQVGGFHSAKIERPQDAILFESGSISVDASMGADFEEGYYRLVMTATQGDISERVDVATLHCVSVGGTVNGGNDELSVKGRSVLFPAYGERLLRGTYAPKGCDGAEYAAEMLSRVLRAPVEVQGRFIVDRHVVFDLGSRVVEAASKLLEVGGWCMQVDGHGTVTLCEKPSEPALQLDTVNASLMMPSVSHDLDWSSVPNRYVAVDGYETAYAVNDDPASRTSTAQRGYVLDAGIDSSPVRINGETLSAYCERKLAENSVVRDTRVYTREYYPGVVTHSLVRGSLASVNLDGDLRVLSQSLDCSHGITVTEKSCKEVRSWPV